MATHSPLLTGGQGTVLPATPATPAITSTNSSILITNSTSSSSLIPLSTQLIIWGMVGFILVELLAVLCLLRYCCRARYIKKRKFKEREIILSDQTEKAAYLYNQNQLKQQPQQQPQQQQQNVILNNSTNKSNLINTSIGKESMLSSKPIMYNQTQADLNQNETIMIDDITSVYSTHHHHHYNTKPKYQKPNHIEMHVNIEPANDHHNHQHQHHHHHNCSINQEPEIVHRQEKTEDVYTLRYTTSKPIEPFDINSPKEHQSYLYNGGLNRPAFEIISHADVRPATPIKFEQAKELNIQNTNFNYDNNINNSRYNHNTTSTYRRYDKYTSSSRRSYTQPIHLNYSDERSFRDVGERVEWQTANELRTTDWDRLKRMSNSSDDLRTRNKDFYNERRIMINDNDQFIHHDDDDKQEQSKKTIYSDYYNLLDYYNDNRSSLIYDKFKSKKHYYFDRNSNLINSDFKSNNLFTNKSNRGQFERGDKLRSESTTATTTRDEANINKFKSSTNTADSNAKSQVLTRIIRDPDSNEILSKQKINLNNNNNNNSSLVFNSDGEARNISIIDVTYKNRLDDDLDLESKIPKLPPPLQFQQSRSESRNNNNNNNNNNSNKSETSSKRSSIISIENVKKNLVKSVSETSAHHSRRGSTTLSTKKHENEDFRSTHEINIQPDAISITTHHQAESPDLVDYIKKLDKIDTVINQEQKDRFNFSEMTKNFLETFSNENVTSVQTKNDLLTEIQNFSNWKLKHVKRDSMTNEHNEAAEEVSPVQALHDLPRSPSPQIVRKKISEEDRASIASSMNKNSAHLY